MSGTLCPGDRKACQTFDAVAASCDDPAKPDALPFALAPAYNAGVEIRLDDTIAALASPAGPGERGIVRLSGPAVRETLEGLFAPDDPAAWSRSQSVRRRTAAARWSGRLVLRNFRVQPAVAVYFWPGRRSYTGQPAAELHLPGSPPLLEAALGELYLNEGTDRGLVRPARPGEFTLRAFLSGRIDLVQAEAVLGVIDAHDHRQLETALRQLAGGLSGRVADVRGDLVDLLAELEAGLDFVEEDIEFVSREELLSRIGAAGDAVAGLLQAASARMISTGRRRVVIAGLPNAGKSTLFNALIGRGEAIVSEVAGTTRDYLIAECDWNGAAVELVDTAGWDRDTDDLDAQAQEFRRAQVEGADLVLWCTAADFDPRTRRLDNRLRKASLAGPTGPNCVRCPGGVLKVLTKIDLRSDCAGKSSRPSATSGMTAEETADVSVAAVDGTGLDALVARAVEELSDRSSAGGEFLGTTSARCRESLESTAGALYRARSTASGGAGEEIVAVDLYDALDHLGRILGVVYTDDILDRIFSRFCIGK